jgi:hypothetical protein
MSQEVIIALIAAIGGVLASSGVWSYIQYRIGKNSARDRLLKGMAYDKIITVGMTFIHRGWVSKDEYEEYQKYLVEPYKAMGGNGVADRVAREVESLSFRRVTFAEVVVKENNDAPAQ